MQLVYQGGGHFVFYVPFFVQELHDLIQLHHEVQLLWFKLNISQLADEKLLPLLEKLDPSDRYHEIETQRLLTWRWGTPCR